MWLKVFIMFYFKHLQIENYGEKKAIKINVPMLGNAML